MSHSTPTINAQAARVPLINEILETVLSWGIAIGGFCLAMKSLYGHRTVPEMIQMFAGSAFSGALATSYYYTNDDIRFYTNQTIILVTAFISGTLVVNWAQCSLEAFRPVPDAPPTDPVPPNMDQNAIELGLMSRSLAQISAVFPHPNPTLTLQFNSQQSPASLPEEQEVRTSNSSVESRPQLA